MKAIGPRHPQGSGARSPGQGGAACPRRAGLQGIKGVRQGKYLEIDLDGGDPDKALADVEAMCKTLLANTVIENYRVEIAE